MTTNTSADAPPPYSTAVDPGNIPVSTGAEDMQRIQSTLNRPPQQQQQGNTARVVQALETAGNVSFAAGERTIEAVDMVSKGLEGVKKVLGDSDNPVLSHMIQLADRLVDVGKTVPFVAPAFVVLKFIIDIERKAREADEKCQDLMERINFMISHVLILERIQETASLMESLHSVLQRVQDSLKDAASLIEAYRKQSKITRRLKMSNTQNFETMADKIKNCSSDLMLSLQIQQTGDLSIIKRAVPRDVVAETFVKENGGQDAINANPDLVKEFAEKMHMAMSDQVMEQMQSNFQMAMGQNQQQIERLIRESSSSGIADTIKSIAQQQREWEAGRKLTCVQCEKEYNVSINGPESCGFHAGVGEFDRYHCCLGTAPCQKGYHQPEHHSLYPYGKFFSFAASILIPTDTVDDWANLRDIDLEDDSKSQLARVGQFIRWRTWGELEMRSLMLVNIGEVREGSKYYLEIFDAATLEQERRKVALTGQTRIFRNASDEEAMSFAMGEWVLDPETQQLTGIKLTLKSASSKGPTVCVVPLDPKELKIPPKKKLEYLAKNSWEVFKPDRPYTFPETIQMGPTMRETRLRDPRTFKSKSPTNIPLVLIVTTDIAANNNVRVVNGKVDRFVGFWRALNTSTKPIVLMSAKAVYRLVGESEYKDVKTLGYWKETLFPLTVKPAESIDIPFEFTVDKPAAIQAQEKVAVNFAHVAVHSPVRVKITFTDMEGATISLVQEYVHGVFGTNPRKEEDLAYFFVDDVDQCLRTLVRIKPPQNPKAHILTITPGLGMSLHLTEIDMHRIVYRAQQTGVTEVDMKLGTTDLGISWTIWALVDLSCKRVYGFKVLLYHGNMWPVKYTATLGYCPCPLYGGDNLETRPIQYAEEKEIVPKITPLEHIVDVEDDTVDDEVEPAPASPPSPQVIVPIAAPAPVPNSSLASTQTTTVAPSTLTLVPPPAPVHSIASATSLPVPTPVLDTVAIIPTVTAISSTTTTESAGLSKLVTSTTSDPLTLNNSIAAAFDLMNAKIAALEARLAASERQDALMNKILSLEQKLESAAAGTNGATTEDRSNERISVLESRLASMDQKLDSINMNLRLLDGNTSRLANSLDKIANVLST